MSSLIEEGQLPEFFVSGIGRIEKLAGGMVRVVFYSERRLDTGEVERVAVCRMIRPIATWHESLQIVSRALAIPDVVVVPGADALRMMN